MAEMGETVEPVLTALQQGFNEFLSMLVMLMQMVDFTAIAGGITTIMQAAAGLISSVQNGALTAQNAFAIVFSGLQQLLANIYAYLTANLPQNHTIRDGYGGILLHRADTGNPRRPNGPGGS